jgi:hypothetical protein
MPNQSRPPDRQQPLELIPVSPHERRHELVTKLVYKLWEQRGRPLGSPDVDWLAAEQAVYASLAASGMITPFPNDPQNTEGEMYRHLKSPKYFKTRQNVSLKRPRRPSMRSPLTLVAPTANLAAEPH